MSLFQAFVFIFSAVEKSNSVARHNSEVLFFPAVIHFTVNNRHLSRSPFFVQVDHQCGTIDSPLVQKSFGWDGRWSIWRRLVRIF
jgi:hypothetical protein